MEAEITFTHYFVTGFGWEDTIFLPSDFERVEKLGVNNEGTIYIGFNDKGTKHILRDSCKKA